MQDLRHDIWVIFREIYIILYDDVECKTQYGLAGITLTMM